ncbi:hypothetical protein CR513_31916, partial [Mucuna pruriens]
MKKRPEPQDLEVLKAVAQAWYSHSGTSKPMSEFDAHRRNFKGKPSRFKLEAFNKPPTFSKDTYWDFQHSLWDSYELVTVSRRIETGLALDNPFDDLCVSTPIQNKRKPENFTTHSLMSGILILDPFIRVWVVMAVLVVEGQIPFLQGIQFHGKASHIRGKMGYRNSLAHY